jgi:hypothetical protein
VRWSRSPPRELAAGHERAAHRREAGDLLLERHLVEHEARDDLVHAAIPEQIRGVARITAREAGHDARVRQLPPRAVQHVRIGIDADQRHAARAAADLHELRPRAAADVGDHVPLARGDLREQRSAPPRRAREHDASAS